MQNPARISAPRLRLDEIADSRCQWENTYDISLAPRDVSSSHISCWLELGSKRPAVGDTWNRLVITLEGREVTLDAVQVHSMRQESGRPFVVLNVVDSNTASQLWVLRFHLRQLLQQQGTAQWDRLSLPSIPGRGLYTEEARQERLTFVREQTGVDADEVGNTRLEPQKLVSNVEAFIGSVEIPVGLAGPLQICGSRARGIFYAPLATSEGALVASVTRGAKALSLANGVTTRVLGQRMMRVPVFSFDDMEQALFFAEWIQSQERALAEEVRKYSNYATLTSVKAEVMGRNAHVHFVYETGDAAGQNMTTTCTWQVCQWIMQKLKAFDGLQLHNFLIEANLSNDKKVTYQSFLKGRGIRVMAEALLPSSVCEQILKVTGAQLVSAYHSFVAGSLAAGMVGLNINVANVIAAMFTALGQDIACVHESSLAQLHLELTDAGDVYCTMTLPSLVIGTVGGGTSLPQQKQCLSILGCAGSGNAHKLAEIMAGFCLALDLSTLSAIAADQFARAHEKLGRNRPVEYLKLADINTDFFTRALRELQSDTPAVMAAQALTIENNGSSIITELTSQRVNKLLGLFPYQLTTETGTLDVMVKVKPLDAEVVLLFSSMAAMCEARLSQQFQLHRNDLGFRGCHVRELAVMSQQDPRIAPYLPKVYGLINDPGREIWVLVEELLQGLELMDSAHDVSGWTQTHLEAAITGVASCHSVWYGREEELCKQPWMVDYPTHKGMVEKQRLWEMLGVHAREEFPEWFTDNDLDLFNRAVNSIDDWWAQIESMPRTLVHNDFNPRNLAFRPTENGPMLCLYDWELATLHLPQRDLAEILAFVLSSEVSKEEIEHYIELHRKTLEHHSGKAIDPVQWRLGYTLALLDMIVNRLSLYLMAHTFRDYKFMARVVKTFRHMLELEGLMS